MNIHQRIGCCFHLNRECIRALRYDVDYVRWRAERGS
ncbi:TPA: hypothetical protein MIU41_13875 [Klebsiella pneumoniae]|nr:hypothetical protein [Klebsiella pneumoniae]